MIQKIVLFFLVASLWLGGSFVGAVDVPSIPEEVLKPLRHMPVQYNGRVKPFESFSREALDLIYGAQQFERHTAVETVVHMMAFPEVWELEPILSVPYRPLRESLGLSSKGTHIAYQDLFGSGFMKRLPPIVQKQDVGEKLTMLENETMDLYARFTTLHRIFSHEVRLVPSGSSRRALWLPMTQLSDLQEGKQERIQSAWHAWLAAYRENSVEAMRETLKQLSEEIKALHPAAIPAPWRLSLEVQYHHMNPLRLSWIAFMIAVFFLGLSLNKEHPPMRRLGLIVFFIAFLFLTSGIVIRSVLAERPPVSNFYESMLWLAWVTIFLGFLFEIRYQNAFSGISAALFGSVTLLLSEHLPLDPALQPVIAVLRSNLWLSIHVLTIVASYGALTLATGVAHCYAGALLLGKGKVLDPLGTILYKAIQIGVVLLAAGIMLGAVWANASWGRYWGWDPKETWALITLLWFLALLHAKKTRWIEKTGLAIGTILGFFLLLMTYYGVSFYLVGLHSYAGGNAKPLPPLLIGYVIAEIAFLILVSVRLSHKKKLSS